MKYVLLCLTGILIIASGTAFADVLIISNNGVTENTLSVDDVKEIFLGKKIKWSDNTKVHFVVLNDPDVHKKFLESYIDKTESQFKRYWKQMVFSGRGAPLKSFDTPEDLIKYVSSTEGAIGYIDEGTAVVNVKTINLSN